jgi:predicted DNA-binding transcriptional regulator AlpA
METLLTQREAASVLRLSERTLERSRVSGTGPSFCKLGRRVFYRQCDIVSWIESHIVNSTSETTPSQEQRQ